MQKNIIIFLVVVCIAILVFALFSYQQVYYPKDASGEDISFVIYRGESVSRIAQRLEEEKIISSSYMFVLYNKLKGQEKTLKAGSYVVSPAMNIPRISELFISGDAERILIIEGWNLRDIAAYLEKAGYGEQEEFFRLAGIPPLFKENTRREQTSGELKNEFSFLKEKPDNLPLEGYLFPDTYSIAPDATMEEIIHAMLQNFESKITEELKEEMEKKEMSLFEAVTIASMIEKEVITMDDKKLVSGIIEERLKRGMPLQIDATVTYLTGKRSVIVPREDREIDSPYNTYLYKGLPEGPISNPGIKSIKAAIRPKESDYLYYLSKPDGETVFSRTLEEHNRARIKYLR